ncbi:MAG: hypothetical protein D6757_05865 [Alphaproteobacteria bacterium]|nr:MAG: hypothetical protein D6757_05865 [Alphaproteobacteria bacterium]
MPGPVVCLAFPGRHRPLAAITMAIFGVPALLAAIILSSCYCRRAQCIAICESRVPLRHGLARVSY